MSQPDPPTPAPSLPEPLTGPATRVVLIAFFGALVGLSLFLTRCNQGNLEKLRHAGDDKQAFYKCLQVLSGDTIVVQRASQTNAPERTIRVVGIEAPPIDPGATNAAAFADRIGVSTNTLFAPRSVNGLNLGQISRNALVIWMHKQVCLLEFPNPSNDLAYVKVSGVDLGRTHLRSGQAIAPRQPDHKLLDEYLSYEREAREHGFGIWHPELR